jgi:NADH:ubiquinone oxidoreductase subunit 3 (subunit A)
MQNYTAHFDGSVVILLFLIVAVGLGIWLFCINVLIPRERYERGRRYALDAFEKFGDDAKDGLEDHIESAKIFDCFCEFEKGIISVLKTRELDKRGLKEMQTYEEAKQRGVKFAEQILRNYPETGLESLRRSIVDHRNTSIHKDSCFADGIEEVLSNLTNMGR